MDFRTIGVHIAQATPTRPRRTHFMADFCIILAIGVALSVMFLWLVS